MGHCHEALHVDPSTMISIPKPARSIGLHDAGTAVDCRLFGSVTFALRNPLPGSCLWTYGDP